MDEINLVLLGPPASGKGTLAEKLCEKFSIPLITPGWNLSPGEKHGIPHISTGDLLREEIKNETPLGLKVKEVVENGGLVDDSIVEDILFKKLSSKAAFGGFILDGFPRNLVQARALNGYLAGREKSLAAVLYLKVPKEEIIRRISGRRQCKECSAVYNIHSNPPKEKGKCGNCGGKLFSREDDLPKTVEKRWNVFISMTQPVVEFYRNRGLLHEVDMLGTVGENFLKALKALEGIKK